MKRVLSAMTLATMLLMVRPVSADSPTTVLNAVQNQGNTSGQAAIGTSGNTNQNNNQNSLGTSSATSVNIGGISITPGTTGGGLSGLNAAESGTGTTGEGYVGYSGSTTFASPSITFGSSNVKNINVNLPGLPGLLGAPGNFSQPYKPDVFINGAGPVRPARMTYEQAQECRGGYGYKDTYVGATRDKAKEIQLVYAAWDKIDVSNDISNYVGISSVEGSDKPWLPAVCEAAYHAMDKGANYGVVEFIIRPKNTMKGFGFGSSGGGSVVPNVATATSPYGLAASLGFGMGWSSQRVEGEVMIQLTGMRVPTQTAAVKPPVPAATAPQVPVAPAAPAPAAPAAATPATPPPAPQATITPAPTAPVIPPRPADDGRVIKPDGQTLKLQPEARPQSGPDQPDPQPLSVPGQPQSVEPTSIPDPSQSAAPTPLSVPGQPGASAPPDSAPIPNPTPLNVPGQPSAAAPTPSPSQTPAPAPAPSPAPSPAPLTVPGQPAAFAPQQQQSGAAAIPASFSGTTATQQASGIQGKLNGAGGR